MNKSENSFNTKSSILGSTIQYFRLPSLYGYKNSSLEKFPHSIRILIENMLRNENQNTVTASVIEAMLAYNPKQPTAIEIPFLPSRVLLQDFTGVPAIVDLAAMRSAMKYLGGNPQLINPQIPVDLVIDHSVQVDYYGSTQALQKNSQLEFQRNQERYKFLHWGKQAFTNFNVIPPASGICHQVNLEHLGTVVTTNSYDSETFAFFDSLVGTDSHTPMINGLGVLGWGVGGIEAEAAMLGQPIFMLSPAVVGVKLTGTLPDHATATDLVLTITQQLRKLGVVGKFVEFFGEGLNSIRVPDRATISNMAPEYGATVGYFPVDALTIDYMKKTGRRDELISLTERYFKEQDMFRTHDSPVPHFSETISIDLSTIESSIAGPKRPQDRIALSQVPKSINNSLISSIEDGGFNIGNDALPTQVKIPLADGSQVSLGHGSIVLAAITSCTNTSNPTVLITAGLIAKKACSLGLTISPAIKTSFAPGSLVVSEYLQRSQLLPYFEELGFHIVGFGCTTCIGNSGPLIPEISQAIQKHGLVTAAVLSGNRNFEGRVNPLTKANYLASPPLVIAYALAGHMNFDFANQPLGSHEGKDIYLNDLWPSQSEIEHYLDFAFDPQLFKDKYKGIEQSNAQFNEISSSNELLYPWDSESTYIQEPPFFKNMTKDKHSIVPISNCYPLAKLGDSITTDHISPAGSIDSESPAGKYLLDQGISPKDFNSYGSRRGNDRVMTRGTFANIRLRNALAPETEGGWTTYLPTHEQMTIYDAAMKYLSEDKSTIIIGGKDYGMGSSRDWAAKGTLLLGVKAVLAESFERIHRSNLVGMGVLPLQFQENQNLNTLQLSGTEIFAIQLNKKLHPQDLVTITATSSDKDPVSFKAICRLDTEIEIEYYKNGGILHTILLDKLNNNQ